jgi:hypothetical protein
MVKAQANAVFTAQFAETSLEEKTLRTLRALRSTRLGYD